MCALGFTEEPVQRKTHKELFKKKRRKPTNGSGGKETMEIECVDLTGDDQSMDSKSYETSSYEGDNARQQSSEDKDLHHSSVSEHEINDLTGMEVERGPS